MGIIMKMTKNREALIRLFYTNPGKSYYMREVGKILGKKPGVFQRMINNLDDEGVLTSQYIANARFFRANKKHPLYKELTSLARKLEKFDQTRRSAKTKKKRRPR